jgi:hypothetical protein
VFIHGTLTQGIAMTAANDEWKISIREIMPPTELGKYLFDEVMRRLGWRDNPKTE